MKFKKYASIAVDFDGTLCENEFPEIGAPKKEVIKYIRWQASSGCKIILFTCREDLGERKYLSEAVEWCRNNGVPIDYVNENPDVVFSGRISRKPVAECYIDDKAMNVAEIETEGQR